MKLFYCLFVYVSCFNQVSAVTFPPVPTEPFYFEPPVVTATLEQQALSCAEIELAINTLHPYRYTYKPEYFSDGLNQTATGLVLVDSLPLNGLVGLGYLTYSALVDKKETLRMLNVEQNISALQQLKAKKHCYE